MLFLPFIARRYADLNLKGKLKKSWFSLIQFHLMVSVLLVSLITLNLAFTNGHLVGRSVPSKKKCSYTQACTILRTPPPIFNKVFFAVLLRFFAFKQHVFLRPVWSSSHRVTRHKVTNFGERPNVFPTALLHCQVAIATWLILIYGLIASMTDNSEVL